MTVEKLPSSSSVLDLLPFTRYTYVVGDVCTVIGLVLEGHGSVFVCVCVCAL